MLTIYFGDLQSRNFIYNTSVFFDNQYNPEWITTSFAKELIQDVDQSTVISAKTIDSPVLGTIPVRSLSGGVKTVLLVKNMPKKIFNASTCGDNCAKWLLKIGEEQDVTVNLRHMMNFGKGEFTVCVKNNKKVVHSMAELVTAAAKYVWG